MGVCFVEPKNFHRFILDFVPPSPGPIKRLEPPHETLGEHYGLHTLTVGQGVKGKNGLWLASHKRSQTGKFFVASRCVDTNTVYVVEDTKHPALYSDSLVVEETTWICGNDVPDFVFDDNDHQRRFSWSLNKGNDGRLVDFQYNNSVPITEPCVISRMDDFGLHHVRLKNPFRAITPGQFAVFYKGDELLGSGKTLRPGPSLYDIERGDSMLLVS